MSNENQDIIKMDTNTTITNSNGEPIQIKVPKPEYITETFNVHTNNSRIYTGDGN